MTIGDRIKEIREEEKLNQRDFASSIKVGQSTLAMFENGQREPRDIHIEQICLKYNINEEWLRTGNGEMYIELEENDLIKQAAILLGEKDPMFEAFVNTYSKLNKANRKAILDFGIELLENLPNKTKKE